MKLPLSPPWAAYLASLLVVVAGDLLWLGLIATPLYQQGIGHLMAERPGVPAALAFYLLYALGLQRFVVLPRAGQGGTAMLGALFGLVAYGTYDLTNLATLRGWPWTLAVVDMAWGCLLSALASAAGAAAWRRQRGHA